MPENPTYSSVHMKERDRIWEERHRKELDAQEKKFQILKHNSDDVRRQLYDARHRGEKLAQRLGFEDMMDAQSILDIVDHIVPYKSCLERVQILESDLSQVKQENEQLKAIRDLWEEMQKGETEWRSCSGLQAEHDELKKKYDELVIIQRRAAERYKQDYKKWRNFDKWLFTEDEQHRKYRNEEGITAEEKKRRDARSISRKKEMMLKLGPDLARSGGPIDGNNAPQRPPPLGRTDMIEDDKENQATPSAQITISSSHSSASSSRTINAANPQIQRIAKYHDLPSSSPTIFIQTPTTTTSTSSCSTRAPLSFRTIPNTEPHSFAKKNSALHMSTNAEPINTPTPTPKPPNTSNGLRPSLKRPLSPIGNNRVLNSNPSEEDSQEPIIYSSSTAVEPTASDFKLPLTRNPPNVGGSSDTEDDSQAPDPTPLPQRGPGSSLLDRISMQRHPVKKFDPSNAEIQGRENTVNRPTKVRRLSGEEFGNDSVTPCPRDRDLKSTVFKTQVCRSDPGRGKQGQKNRSTACASAGQKKVVDDYSAFKGRGRYAKTASDGTTSDKTINSLYMIDPTQNGGLNHPYDEVVRNQDQRRRMDGGDCECCRDYYQAVGPLPKRLKQPLWRSPTAIPCTHHSGPNKSSKTLQSTADSRREQDIENHKKNISRHRHTWARPSTPPGYWNIGFPNTQEVGNINEKAEEMHRKKMQEVEREVERGNGRYKRR